MQTRTCAIFALIMIIAAMLIGCEIRRTDNTGGNASNGGVKPLTVHVPTGSSGTTVEQDNISKRLTEDNRVGAIKHIYIISAYSGDVIMYSTVKGKITSSGKRLTPYTVAAGVCGHANGWYDYGISYGKDQRTSEVMQDDGTYGSSDPYIYWWDVKGIYHQHYVSGGQIVHVSDQPLPIKKVIINVSARE